jgi:hypothetical protein
MRVWKMRTATVMMIAALALTGGPPKPTGGPEPTKEKEIEEPRSS